MTDLREQLSRSLGPGFVLGDELGGGGMSRVFLARDSTLGRSVVVKVLAPDLAAELSVERFTREVRLLASMQQANIVPVIGAGACDGLPWFTMPYVEGRSLRDRLQHGPLPINEVLDIVRDVARALAYAHDRGIIHRDIKPDNVLLSGGTAVVTDFGIAKAIGAAQTGGQTLTNAGSAIGTPAYMAPEQIANDPNLDGRADLYALGCLTYELLAGRPPFDGLPPAAIFSAHLTAEPAPVSSLRADTPPAIAAIVARCLAKDPADRPQTAAGLLRDVAAMPTPVGGAPARRRRGIRIVIGVWAVAGVIAAALAYGRLRPAAPAAPASVVVLPFANSDADSTQQYLADGITEELIAGLARVSNLRVISRSLAFRYRGAEADPRRVARELDAANVLSGSVRHVGNGIHVVAELARSDGTVVWSNSFDHGANGVASIEAEIIQAAATRMRVALGADAKDVLARRVQLDPEAHDLYLRGRFFWTQRSEEGLRRSIELYRESIDREPRNTYALSGLADAYAVSAWYSYLSPEDGYGRAKTIARQALAIDSTLAEPNASLGYVALYYDWDWPAAQRLFERSIALDSTYATGHQWYGNYLVAMGRLPEGVGEFRTAERLDPANRISTGAVCWALGMARRPVEAIAQCRRAFDLDSTLAVAHLWAGQALEAVQDTASALHELETAVRLGHRSAVTVAGLAHALASFGQTAKARALLPELETSTNRYHPSYEIATVHAALGDADLAIKFLDRAVVERAHSIALLGVDPALDPIRHDARLAAVMQKVGLPEQPPLRE